MGAIADSRAELEALLAAAGLRVAEGVTGPFASPCVSVSPGDPWVVRQPAGLSGLARRVRWRLVLIAGVLDADGTLELLEEMIDRTVPALVTAGRWELPEGTVSGPRRLPSEGVTYLTAELLVGQLVTIAAPAAASEVNSDGG